MRLRAAAVSYVSRKRFVGATSRKYLASFVDMWGDVPLRELTGSRINEWVDERLLDVSGPTVRRELNLLLAVLAHAVEREWIDKVPRVVKPDDGEARLRVLTGDEVSRLLAAGLGFPEFWLITFLLHTGARVGEAVAVDVSKDVHDGALKQYVVLRTRKKRGAILTERRVPLNNTALSAVKGGFHWSSSPAACAAIQRAGDRAKLVDFRPHDLRRTFATRLLEGGVSPRTVADLLGHSSLAMVMRYAVPSDELKTTAVKGLE